MLESVFSRNGDMPAVSVVPCERSRKNLQVVLQRFGSVGQVTVADALKVSEATISRWKAEEAERCAAILAKLGLKIVAIEARCFDPKQIGAILTLAKERMNQFENPDSLEWDE